MKEVSRQICAKSVPLHEMDTYFSAHRVTDGLLNILESLLVHSFPNDLLNVKIKKAVCACKKAMPKHITQSQLESYLWRAATLLRGHIDAGDYKQFIFPLLFYKRLCDDYDEKLVEALEGSGGDAGYAALSEQYRFQIPDEAHWNATRANVREVGKAIQDALRAIESANPDKLQGVLGDAHWTNKERLPDSMLRELLEHFSSLTLSLVNCPEDELGVGYEFFIKKFADDSGHTAAEFYTHRTVVYLMTEMLEPQPGESVYDHT